MIERFLALSNDERRKMGEHGRQKVQREFSRTVVVDAYLEKINELTSQTNSEQRRTVKID